MTPNPFLHPMKSLILQPMKKIILFLTISFGLASSIFAQKMVLPPIYEDAATLQARYQLDEQQQAELTKILATRQANLEAIVALQSSDPQSFWKKRKATYLGQQAAIERLLVGKTQKAAFAAVKLANRLAESEQMQALLADGYNREEVRFLVLGRLY